MNKNVLLLDIDYTLFNTDKIRDITSPVLMKILQQEDTPQYHDKVKEIEHDLVKKGSFEPLVFANILSQALQIPPEKERIEKLYYDEKLYDECLYTEVKDVLRILSLKKDLTLGVVSQGDDTFQRRKIEPIISYFREENVFISSNKLLLIEKLFTSYSGMNVYIVDDSEKFLDSVQRTDKNIFTILIERKNRHVIKKGVEGFIPDKKITTLDELLPLVDKLWGN